MRCFLFVHPWRPSVVVNRSRRQAAAGLGVHFAARTGGFTDFMAVNDEIRWGRPLTPAVYKASRVHQPPSFVASLQLAAYAKIQSESESGGWQHSPGWREPVALKDQTNG
jgi:hypothetical protein